MATSGHEEMISDLADRVSKLEMSHTYTATQSEVRVVEMELLEKLKAIRDAMKADVSGSISGSSVEMEALRAENASLKAQIEKKNYRILHLVKSIKEITGQIWCYVVVVVAVRDRALYVLSHSRLFLIFQSLLLSQTVTNSFKPSFGNR